jgi:hypothetical protein
MLLDILEGAGNLFDLPGSMVRDAVTLNNPFDQLLSPLGSQNRMSGRDVLEQYGALSPNQAGLDFGDVAGGALGMAMDPLSYISGVGALKFLARGSKLDDVAKLIPKAGQAAARSGPGTALVPYRNPLAEVLGLADAQPLPTSGGVDPSAFLANAFGSSTPLALPAPAAPFYSRLRRAVEALPDKPIKSQSLLNTLKKNPEGISMDEWEWTDMTDFVADNPMLTKQQILKHMDQWGIGAKRVDYDRSSAMPPIYGEYAMPERTDYRETLIQELTPASTRSYQGPHWQEPDVTAHLRTSTRNVDDAGPVHFIDELQSDWHQTGRDRGYAGSTKANAMARELAEVRRVLSLAEDVIEKASVSYDAGVAAEAATGIPYREAIKASQELPRIIERYESGLKAVAPASPFANSWQDLGLKQALYDAAAKGSPGIGWSTGEDIRKLVGGVSGGQNKFYDTEIGNRLTKLLGSKGQKGVGPKMLELTDLTSRPSSFTSDAAIADPLMQLLDDVPEGPMRAAPYSGMAHYMPIAPEVRARILAEGFPLLAVPLMAALGYGLTPGGNERL